ncbi:hypothetical protein PFISCL1PPCAC_22112, partial [Pristionchus fissidentatus]
MEKQVQHVNEIYRPIDLGGIKGIQFKIAAIKIWKNSSADGYPFITTNTTAEHFLQILTRTKHDEYCLSYVWTYRTFDRAIQGLAYSCHACGKFGAHATSASLNVGLVSFMTRGQTSPRSTWHLTLAHELGHHLGSGHDFDLEARQKPECGYNGAQELNSFQGHFIMHALSNSGAKPNHHKFSPCSIRNISRNL